MAPHVQDPTTRKALELGAIAARGDHARALDALDEIDDIVQLRGILTYFLGGWSHLMAINPGVLDQHDIVRFKLTGDTPPSTFTSNASVEAHGTRLLQQLHEGGGDLDAIHDGLRALSHLDAVNALAWALHAYYMNLSMAAGNTGLDVGKLLAKAAETTALRAVMADDGADSEDPSGPVG